MPCTLSPGRKLIPGGHWEGELASGALPGDADAGGYDIPGKWIMDAEFDNLSKITKVKVPVCLFSGLDDTFVTPEHTQELYKTCPRPPKNDADSRSGSQSICEGKL